MNRMCSAKTAGSFTDSVSTISSGLNCNDFNGGISSEEHSSAFESIGKKEKLDPITETLEEECDIFAREI